MVITEELKYIIHSPELPQIIEHLQAFWEDEKERRKEFYDWVTPSIKAEFIDGDIIVHSPVRSKHSVVLMNLVKFIGIYVDIHELGYIGVEKIMCRFPRNDYEPDLCFFKKEIADTFHDKQTIFPVPQLIVEILSNSTENRDRGVKFQDYQANGVKEYWIVDAEMEIVEQYVLSDDEYKLQKHTKKSILESPTLNSFKVNIKAFFDKKHNLEALKSLSQ